ncbi:MAG: tRNA pseudouridine(38-40) synthase TruA [Peptococcaceae bacterium]|nr:tRNA pseudouridine(38-40) synthase TruA [Peptococcaceae bacterium]
MGKMRNIKLVIAYDGTKYHGFQEQRGTGLATIQETLERILASHFKQDIQVFGASRTDSGVHACGQVVNFYTETRGIPTKRIPLTINVLLPEDIVIKTATDVAEDFHARFSAKSKRYRYVIYNSRVPNPFYHRYSMFEPRLLDLEAMREAAKYLEGTHDFSAFKGEGPPVKSAVRTLSRIDFDVSGKLINLFFTGDGFLYNMVRILTGTLLDVGLKKYSPVQIMDILESKQRTMAGPTVPPSGLSLMEVYY